MLFLCLQPVNCIESSRYLENGADIVAPPQVDLSSTSRLGTALREEWIAFEADVAVAEAALMAAEGGFAFSFVEGALVQALQEGSWLLLDEINLAPPEALERMAGLLDGPRGSLVLAERGDGSAIIRHESFRLFAAMNPATDAGKRDLPAPLRNHFTELWVSEPTSHDDFAAIVDRYLPGIGAAIVDGIVRFYFKVKEEADAGLQDGAGHKPAYNLRTLCRALEYCAAASSTYGLARALCDGLDMSFVTQLDQASVPRVKFLIEAHCLGGKKIQVIVGEGGVRRLDVASHRRAIVLADPCFLDDMVHLRSDSDLRAPTEYRLWRELVFRHLALRTSSLRDSGLKQGRLSTRMPSRRPTSSSRPPCAST